MLNKSVLFLKELTV